MADREAHIGVILGRQGAGKSYRELKECLAYSMDQVSTGKKGRKVLVLDCNPKSGSYHGIRTIDYDCSIIDGKNKGSFIDNGSRRCAEIIKWCNTPSPTTEVRRVVALTKTGEMMNLDQMNQACIDMMRFFTEGKLVLEDTNVYLYGARQKKFVSTFVTVRHRNVDLMLMMQSFSAPDPRIWNNTSILRLHKTMDSPEGIRDKIKEDFELIMLGYLIVNNQYRIGNKYYCLYVDRRKGKLIGCQLKSFENACLQYLSMYPRELKSFMLMRSLSSQEKAIQQWTKEKVQEYL
jgi:hypothetical protein